MPEIIVSGRRFPAVALLAVVLLWPAPARAGEDARIYQHALRASRSGQKEFAFMQYRRILRQYPSSPYARQALFAKGEYDFGLEQDEESAAAFRNWLTRYPDDRGRLFALMYLFRIAQRRNDAAAADQLRQEILTYQQVGLVFRESKELSWASPLGHACRAVFRIDEIDFYVDAKPFAQVPF